MRRRRGALQSAVACAGVLAGAPGVALAAIEVQIEGLVDELEEAVLATLDIAQQGDRPTSAARARYLYGAATEEIRRALEPYGYYGARVEGELSPLGEGRWRARFRVEPGEPVIVRRVDVDAGAAAELPRVRRLVEAFPLAPGETLVHAEYEDGKAAIGTALRGAGFLDAELTAHRVAVHTGERSAEIDLAWEPGRRYRFGELRFAPEAQFGPEFLRGYATWDEGEPYSTDELLALQQRLVDADYFGTVSVEPALEQRADGRVPVDVRLTPAPRNVYSAAVSYSTDLGAGGRLAYERRWLNRRGHKLQTRLEYSQRLEEYSVTYRIPRPGPTNRDHAFGVAYRAEQAGTFDSRALRIAATETLQDWRGWTRVLGLHAIRGDFTIGERRGSSDVFYAEGTLSRLRYDSVAFPREGWSLEYGTRLAAEQLLSETGLAQAWTTGRLLFRSGERNRWILGGRVGAMAVGDFDALPPELRFFAGGDRSVRGFEYQGIGEVDRAGEVIGGEYLATASGAYEWWFRPPFGAAAFVDAGDAFARRFDANVAVGLGARWQSPVGMVRLDVAMPVVTRFDDGLRIHVTIGPDL